MRSVDEECGGRKMEGHDDASLRHRLGRTALFIAAGRAVDTEREKPLITGAGLAVDLVPVLTYP